MNAPRAPRRSSSLRLSLSPLLRFCHLFILITLICCISGCASFHLVRLSDRQEIEVKTLVAEVSASRIVFVGESHDVAAHHRLQLEVIKGLHEAGKEVAIGMEMFEVPTQKALDAWVAGKVPEEAFRKLYQMNWRNLPWSLYEEILLYARDQHIPLVALNAPRRLVQQVSQGGFEAISPLDRQGLPPGATGEVGEAYLDFIGKSYPSHGRNGDAFRRICEAQMLRNRVMAFQLTDYLARHPESTVVVVAGAGHARHKGGVPMELPGVDYRIIVPPLPGVTAETMGEDADYLVQTPFSDLF